MKLNSLTCNHCGAPLEVRQNTRFATCAFCNAKLEVHREGNAIFSEVLEAIDKKADQIAEDVARLKLNSELERIDRQWMVQQERFKIRGQDGQLRVPSKAGGVFVAIAACVMGVVFVGVVFVGVVFVGVAFVGVAFVGVALGGGAPPAFGMFALIFVAVGITSGLVMVAKANDYEQNRRRYQRQRIDVIRNVDQKRLEPA